MKVLDGKEVYSVTEVNTIARQTLENLSFWVIGEVSSYKGRNFNYRYVYFDLKDAKTQYKINCIMEPEAFDDSQDFMGEGISVLALGNLTLWERDGKYQFYIHKIQPHGEGELLLQFEKLKTKLQEKGYFEQEHKKPLPTFPAQIAVITSLRSDAWQDFRRHSIDRFPHITIHFFDVMVQGQKSATQVIKALRKADSLNLDAIAIIRGGGSMEDLVSYNSEELADAIFNAKTPIVVGVGHEKDVTIAQLIADIPSSTPTDAAKIITSSYINLESTLFDLKDKMIRIMRFKIANASQSLDITLHQLNLHKGRYEEAVNKINLIYQKLKYFEESFIKRRQSQLEFFSVRLRSLIKSSLNLQREHLDNISQKLAILSPENTLARGFTITYDSLGKIIKSAQSVAVEDLIRVKFHQGQLEATVKSKEN